MSVEVLLAVAPLVDLCRKYIKEGRALCSSLKNADVEITERVIRLQNNLVRFLSQLNFFQRIQHVMEEEHREVYEQTLRVLQSKLEIVVSILKGLVEAQPRQEGQVSRAAAYEVKSLKYASKKKSLDTAIDELDLWQRTADQSWFLLMKIADPLVDNALVIDDETARPSTAASIPSTRAIRAGLRSDDAISHEKSTLGGISLHPSALGNMTTRAILFCDGMMVATRTHSDGSVGTYILNRIQCEPATKHQIFKRNARDLVRKLQHDEPHTFGLLKCKGFIVESMPIGVGAHMTLTLVFRNPPDSQNPKSLRELLISTPSSTSISRRLDIARDLAKSVGYVHTFGFVHKNVRPESIIVFELGKGKGISTFLAGFEYFRRDEGWTQRLGDDAADNNLYRHNSRQGFSPREDYQMQHDIFSLGVCLLEIGLWGSFVEYHSASGTRSISPLLALPSGTTACQTSAFLLGKGKEHLLSLARTHLPGNMGDKYAKIVETCLTCLDPDNVDFGDEREFEDENGILVGARYIEKVLLRLNMLSM